jgi:hypothetical protein
MPFSTMFSSLRSFFSRTRSSCSCDGALSFTLLVAAFLIVELIFFLFQYFDAYQTIYPGSRVAQNLSGAKGTAYAVFEWLICGCSFGFTFPMGIYLGFGGVGVIAEHMGKLFAALVALPWIAICVFVGSWQLWIYWVMVGVWGQSVWNHACDASDGYAMLQGIKWNDVSTSLPYVGTLTVFLAAGNYTMQLERNATVHSTYYLQNLYTGNIAPAFDRIEYNTLNRTYTIDNATNHYAVSPNLAFPSLDLVLKDNSIPFGNEGDMPLANLIYRNGSTSLNVLDVVKTDNHDCTKMKVCVNTKPEGDFEIALGVLMIRQYLYGVSCTTPSGDSSDGGSSEGDSGGVTINLGGGSG